MNPQLGFPELVAAQSQPEVVVNAADRSMTRALGGEITIDIDVDDDYVLQASDPPDPEDEWPYSTIRVTDAGPVLTGPVDVVYPDVDALYGGPSRLMFVFMNETGETLTVKRSGQSGVSVAQGDAALLWHDGVDVRALINPLP